MSATKSGNGLQKTCNIVLSVSYTIFILFFDFSVAFVVREEKSLIDKGFSRGWPGNGVGNGTATGSATRSAFQNGSSIWRVSSSVSSRKPSGKIEPVAAGSLPEAARSQPRCLPYLAKMRGLENAVQPSMLLFMISLISRISHCFGSSKEWFRASS